MRAGGCLKSAAVTVLLMLGACQSIPSRSVPDAKGTLIRDVTVIPMDKPGAMARQDVIIEGGRVVALGNTGTLRQRTAQEVDGRGKYLMPGLWDMHAHTLIASDPALRLRDFRRHGIVGVRDLGSTLEQLNLGRKMLASARDLPEIVAAGPLLDGPRQRWMQTMALPLSTVEEARSAAVSLLEAGVDFLKIYNNLSPDQYAAIAEVARARQIPFSGHVPFRMTVEQVSAAGQASIEHAGLQLVTDCIPGGERAVPAELRAWVEEGYPGRAEERARWWALRQVEQCRALYRRMAERRTWVTPTLANEIAGGEWTTEADISALPSDQQAGCRSNLTSINSNPQARDAANQLLFSLIKEMHELGVPMLAGSDMPNGCLAAGRSLHGELRLLVRAGLSPWDALRTATLNAALFLGRPNEGLVRPGAVANLLLLQANPLVDIANVAAIKAVILRGEWHLPAGLQAGEVNADQAPARQ